MYCTCTLANCHFTPFCMKNFGDLLRSLSALECARHAACARHNYNRREERKFTTVIGEIKLNPRKDEYLTLLSKHTVKLGEPSLVPRSLVTKRSVNREAHFPFDQRARKQSTQMLWVILNYFTILHRQQMLIKLFTRAPVVSIDKMSDFLTLLTKVTTNKIKIQGGYARLVFTHVLRSLVNILAKRGPDFSIKQGS